MPRILKPCPRPYVALGIVFGVVTILAVLPLLRAGKPLQAIQAGGATLGVYGAVALVIARQRIVIKSDSLCFQEVFKPTNQVLFSEISKSVKRTLAEPEHPVALDVYTHNPRKPALRLRLKSFRQVDVAWLISVPELKVKR